MKISLIAAIGSNNELGFENDLCWNVPEDMRHFRRMTTGKVILMGSKTFAAINYCTLPNRVNVILTSRQSEVYNIAMQKDRHLQVGQGSLLTFPALEPALVAMKHQAHKEVFIIGGAQVYAEALAIVDEMYLTHVHGTFQADTYFPEYNHNDWKLVEEKSYFSTDHIVTQMRLVRTTDEEKRKYIYATAGPDSSRNWTAGGLENLSIRRFADF